METKEEYKSCEKNGIRQETRRKAQTILQQGCENLCTGPESLTGRRSYSVQHAGSQYFSSPKHSRTRHATMQTGFWAAIPRCGFSTLIALIRIFGLKEFARAVPVPRGCIASELIGLRQRLRLLSERLTIENNVR